jgi:hypothetical protein
MSRRDRYDSEPPPREGARARLEGVIPDLIKKTVQVGYDRTVGAQESIKNFIADSKLPKEIANAILQQVDDTKNGLFRVVAKEVRGFLEAVDFQRELQKLLTTVSFEIKTEIRFIPNDSAPDKLGRPDVKAKMRVKRQDDRDEKRRRKEPKGARRETTIDLTPPPPSVGTHDEEHDDGELFRDE